MLNRVLLKHIRQTLPDLRAEVETLVAAREKELASFGVDPSTDPSGNSGLLLQAFSSFAQNVKDSIEGRTVHSSPRSSHLLGGARIGYIFEEVFAKCVHVIDPLEGLSDHYIRCAIKNAIGAKTSLFACEAAFENLIRVQIRKLEQPSLDCARLVYDEMMGMAEACEVNGMQRFPVLRERVYDVVRNILADRLKPTLELIRSLVMIEEGFLNTNHPDFVMATACLRSEEGFLNTNHPDDISAYLIDESGDTPAGVGVGGGGVPVPNSRGTNWVSKGSTRDRLPNLSNSSHQYTSSNPDFQSPLKGDRPSAPGFFSFLSRRKPSAGEGEGRDGGQMGEGEGDEEEECVDRSNRAVGGRSQLSSVPKVVRLSDGNLSAKDRSDSGLVRQLITVYFGIVRKTIIDLVPKAVMTLLVNNFRDSIYQLLTEQLYDQKLFAELLAEPGGLGERRKELRATLKHLGEAINCVNQIEVAIANSNNSSRPPQAFEKAKM